MLNEETKITNPGKIAVVLPAYNAEPTLARTIEDIPKDNIETIILVDDCSTDNTAAIGRELGLDVIVHDTNTGYGGNQKSCYRRALEGEAQFVVMLHPDFQYDPRTIPGFVNFLSTGVCDVMLGSRIRTRWEALEGGMPAWKYISNRGLTLFENMVLGQNLGEFHSGFRAYRREVLESVPWEKNSDDFVFDTQFLAQCVYFGFKIGDAPMPVRYFDEASSINFKRSTKYGLETVRTMGSYLCARTGIYTAPFFKKDD